MIVTQAVSEYLAGLRPEPDPVLAEMEAHGARDGIPIVVPETGALLHVLALACGARRVLEVGTAIGVSTLYLVRALPPEGTIVSFEIDAERQAAAREYLGRAGVLERCDLRLEDAREGLGPSMGPSTWRSSTGSRRSTATTSTRCCRCVRHGGLLAVDNVLMSGTVAEGRSDGHWTDEQISTARAFNERLLRHDELSGTLTPVGDGVLVAVRR